MECWGGGRRPKRNNRRRWCGLLLQNDRTARCRFSVGVYAQLWICVWVFLELRKHLWFLHPKHLCLSNIPFLGGKTLIQPEQKKHWELSCNTITTDNGDYQSRFCVGKEIAWWTWTFWFQTACMFWTPVQIVHFIADTSGTYQFTSDCYWTE